MGSLRIHQEGLTAVTADSSFSLGNWREELSSCLGAVPVCGALDLRGKQVTCRLTMQQSEARELAAEESDRQDGLVKQINIC